MNGEYLGNIEFYGESKAVGFPRKYLELLKIISNMLQIPTEMVNNLILSYKDCDGDSIIISNKEDYFLFLSIELINTI